jgi:hypothetical protein
MSATPPPSPQPYTVLSACEYCGALVEWRMGPGEFTEWFDAPPERERPCRCTECGGTGTRVPTR